MRVNNHVPWNGSRGGAVLAPLFSQCMLIFWVRQPEGELFSLYRCLSGQLSRFSIFSIVHGFWSSVTFALKSQCPRKSESGKHKNKKKQQIFFLLSTLNGILSYADYSKGWSNNSDGFRFQNPYMVRVSRTPPTPKSLQAAHQNPSTLKTIYLVSTRLLKGNKYNIILLKTNTTGSNVRKVQF